MHLKETIMDLQEAILNPFVKLGLRSRTHLQRKTKTSWKTSYIFSKKIFSWQKLTSLKNYALIA